MKLCQSIADQDDRSPEPAPADRLHQMRDWCLTTAEILYHLPDHPAVLQSFVWQEMDLAPAFPALRKFLDFWSREIEGRIHSVRVARVDLTEQAALTVH